MKIDIDGLDKFIKELGLTPEKVSAKGGSASGGDKYKIVKKNLPAEETKLVTFNM